jgi:hypothetical protein
VKTVAVFGCAGLFGKARFWEATAFGRAVKVWEWHGFSRAVEKAKYAALAAQGR